MKRKKMGWKKQIMALIICVVLVAISGISAATHDGQSGFISPTTPDNIDFTTGDTIKDAKIIQLDFDLKTKASSGGAVLWDLTHGILNLNTDPSGEFSSLVCLLSSKGYTVNTADAGILNIDLNQYGVLVICLGSAWNSAYTTDEVAAINSFVQNGGGLLVMGDNRYCPNENINPVTHAFGATCGVSHLHPFDLNVTDLAPHPIFKGVSEFYMSAAGEVEGVPPSEEVAWTDSKGTITVATFGFGRVVVTGDIGLFMNDHISYAENPLLAENIFDWLSASASPEISISTDQFNYYPAETMAIIIDMANPTQENLTFQWYWGVPQYGIWVPVMSVPIPVGYDETLNFSIPIPYLGLKPSGNVFYVQFLDASEEVLVANATCWACSPSGDMIPPIGIEEQIKKTIERVELLS